MWPRKEIAAALYPLILLMSLGNMSITFADDRPKRTAQPAESAPISANSRPVVSSCNAASPDSEMDKLLAILVQKHVLSAEEAAGVRAEMKADEGTAVEQAAPLEQTPVTSASARIDGSDAATEATPKLPFKIGGYGQVRWSSLPGSGSTFQLRRARISIDGDLGHLASYKVQAELLNSPALLDAYLQLKPAGYANLTFGQFKVPFSQENLTSSSDLLTVERSQVVNSLVPGRDNGSNGRDIGADLSGSYNFVGSTGVEYAVGVFNGAGIDRKDDNNRKDVAVRLAVQPFRGLSLAGDYYNGAAGTTEVARDRQGAELSYSYHPVTLQGEFIWGRDGAVHEQGWYGLAAWRFSKKWEGVFRADEFDPGRSKPRNTTSTYLGGFNWYFASHLKWQLNEGVQNQHSRLGNVLLSQLQFKF